MPGLRAGAPHCCSLCVWAVAYCGVSQIYAACSKWSLREKPRQPAALARGRTTGRHKSALGAASRMYMTAATQLSRVLGRNTRLVAASATTCGLTPSSARVFTTRADAEKEKSQLAGWLVFKDFQMNFTTYPLYGQPVPVPIPVDASLAPGVTWLLCYSCPHCGAYRQFTCDFGGNIPPNPCVFDACGAYLHLKPSAGSHAAWQRASQPRLRAWPKTKSMWDAA